MTVSADLDQAMRKLAEAGELLSTAQALQKDAATCLQRVFDEARNRGLNAFDLEAYPVTDHRRAHRPGRQAKIDQDAALQAFILARIDRMGFVQIAEDVAAHFPPERRVGKSAINEWWHRNRKRVR